MAMAEWQKIDPAPFIEYLSDILPLLLGTRKSDLEPALKDASNVQNLQEFIGDEQDAAVFISRQVAPEEDEAKDSEVKDGEESPAGRSTKPEDRKYVMCVELTDAMSFVGKNASVVAIVKRAPTSFRAAYEGTLDTDVGGEASADQSGAIADQTGKDSLKAKGPWQHQLTVVNIASMDTNFTVFEMIHSLMNNAMSPVLNSYKKSLHKEAGAAGDDDDACKVGIPIVQRKIAELSMALLQCQQNAEIEDITLVVDSDVQAAAEKAKAEGRQVTMEDFIDRKDDATFLNQLQNGVSIWSKEIQRITKLSRDPSSGSVMAEINFWLGMEKALQDIQNQLQSPEVQLTMNLLKSARRFLATMSFESDTGLKPTQEKVTNYLTLLKELPINDLVVATTIKQVTQALHNIFAHMKKLRTATQYPLWRAYNLAEALSRDLTAQVLKILQSQKIMQLETDVFEQNMQECNELFRVWDDEVRQFKELVREQAKKRTNNERHPLKINIEHAALQERIMDLQKFRRQHTKLQEVIEKVLEGGKDSGAKTSVTSAYQLLEEKVDVLDVSRRGQTEWEGAKKDYDKHIDHAESEITARLRDRLGTAKTATEMFRVFNKFSALFHRQRIRGTIDEYKSNLLAQVREDVQRIQTKFKESYQGTQAAKMTAVRDIPPTAGFVIWAKQLERRLHIYMSRVEDVLGRGWDQHEAGQKLKSEGEALQKKINPASTFETWLKEMKDAKPFDMTMRIFDVHGSQQQVKLHVNFDENITTLFKEVRNLAALSYRVPYAVKANSDDARFNYPFAMTLREATRSYMQTCSMITGTTAPMMAAFHKSAQDLIGSGCGLKWDSDRIEAYTKKLSEEMFRFQQKYVELEAYCEKMEHTIESIAGVDVRGSAKEVFEERFESMQKTVDDMNLHGFSNLDVWVKQLAARIEEQLTIALEKLIQEWIKQFLHPGLFGTSLIAETAVHELRIQNMQLIVEPQKEFASMKWIQHFHNCLGMICNLPKLQAGRFDSLSRTASRCKPSNHLALMQKVNPELLQQAYDAINKKVSDMEAYVASWLQYQALWEINKQTVLSKLGEDIARWFTMLTEIKSRSLQFESVDAEKSFGPIIVNFKQVQSRVKSKYDEWHTCILEEFGQKIADKTRKFYRDIGKAKESLETTEGGTTDLSKMCMEVLKIRDKKKEWDQDYAAIAQGNRLLDRQRYQFPKDWQPFEQIESEWDAFQQILEKRNRVLERELPKLKSMLLKNEKQTDENITMLYAEWGNEKPVKGSIKPSAAMEVINTYEKRLNTLKEEFEQLNSIKQSLSMEVGNKEALAPLQDEMNDLKGVWTDINQIFEKLEELKEIPWTAVVPKKIKSSIEELMGQLEKMPEKLKTYEVYEYMQGVLKAYVTGTNFLTDLKSEALKDRHWKAILGILELSVSFNQLTLGHLWDGNLGKNEKEIRNILMQAQGEMGLEEFLREIKEYWGNYSLDLVPYKSKTRLVKGWDDVFMNLDEHLNSIQSMKLSPYYKTFEEEGKLWDEKLNKVRGIFDLWMDVQRRWVYLEGIFMASADIQTLLPNEFNRFKQIDSEFLGLMKKTAAKPKVLECTSADNLTKSLEKMGDNLNLVQKALGDYLERQRSNFARFYFVGDEDLLEMIGSSRDVGTVSRHLGKMFAGLSALTTEEGNPDVLQCMNSKEGEKVNFVKQVKISDDPSINGWLSKTELAMQTSLGEHLNNSMLEMDQVASEDGNILEDAYVAWVDKYPAQVMLIAILVDWCDKIEKALFKADHEELKKIEPRCMVLLTFMAGKVITDIPKDLRQKLAQMITELVHQRDVTRDLIKEKVASNKDFKWLQLMRMYFNPKEANILEKLTIIMADATFFYGFEYLGIADKLVQTALTDRCFLTLTQALHMKLGANPFGPAGTGKTESVKALGNTMGRFVLVFCCDDGFDFNAMGRIFIGLCQVGAWGCFDEFNRLEERILSAVSEQVLTVQIGNKQNKKEIELLGKPVRLNSNVGIFVTMNPGYAGRSNLPDNLKQLFRAMAMTKPDKTLIAQVNLFNQGFASAERLAGKVVFLFDLCGDQLSSQPHYDFGLRSLKAVLACAGQLKRDEVNQIGLDKLKAMSEEELAQQEEKILLRSVYDTLVPKLVAQDKPLMASLISGTFPGCDVGMVDQAVLQEEIRRLCKLRHLECSDNFMLKCMELYAIQNITHGIMLVGEVGTGKSAVWKILLDAMERVDGIKGDAYVVDPKAVAKEELYGSLDGTTLEWKDGVWTEILRRVTAGLRGEKDRRQWLMFDGDVDPEWAENLNSVLDDNKMLTLPNGERLAIPPNVRIMFEVDTLKYATLATVSRCGMVWFADDVVLPDMVCSNELKKIKFGNLERDKKGEGLEKLDEPPRSMEEKIKHLCVDTLFPLFEKGNLVLNALAKAKSMDHIMVFTEIRALTALFSLIRKGISMVIEYNEHHEDFPLSEDVVKNFITKHLLFGMCWSFGGDMLLSHRLEFCEALAELVSGIPLPSGLGGETTLLDFEVRIEDGEWYNWAERVPVLDITPEQVGDGSLIISTVDTVRHGAALAGWLEERRPFILSGPPGSGKTMTLMSTMKAMSGQLELASLNFSAGTTPELLLQTFELYCEVVKTPNGYVMRPLQHGKWVVVFCDECNLPAADKYNTQRVIMFIRQITEYKGYYRPSDNAWINVERVQFLGACNPPTDPGRHPMSDRFLRHSPVIWVDYPAQESMKQIYGTFNRGMLKLQPHLPKTFAESMTNVMVAFWFANSKQFTSDMQPHYLYSPRELTRWKVALHETLKNVEGMTEDILIRLLMHEALRIFVDRIVFAEEKEWANAKLDEFVKQELNCSDDVITRPILFSCYLSDQGLYSNVTREALREYVQDRLKIFYEEEVAVKLVVFDEVLDHIVRMDRVLRQPLGHLLLVGASGAGKTILSKFVSWMNGLKFYALKIGKGYDVTAFENDLRAVMKRSGVKKEKITFIFDESNALGPAFLERMNALLASGEVPGLFEGDELVNLMSECRSAGGMSGMEDAEMFAKFTKQVQRNLHIVFTMNPANPDFYNRSNSSPALFNRCIIDWFGDWPHEALVQVANEFTTDIEMTPDSFTSPTKFAEAPIRFETLANTIVDFHEKVDETNTVLRKSAMKYNFITPRDFLDFINHFLLILEEKREVLLEQQSHIDGGLKKLQETEDQVNEMQDGLKVYEKDLELKNKDAEETMTQMVKGQGEAEEKKVAAGKLSKDLEEQSVVIAEKAKVIAKQIEEVEPALAEAKAAVKNVNKGALDELRNLKTPPDGVKIAMEAVVSMVRPDISSPNWDMCKKCMKDSNFIPTILEFDTEAMKDSVRDTIEKKYLKSKAWDQKAIDRASKAAGPVAKWVESQIQFGGLLKQMEPMRNELKAMEQAAEDNKRNLEKAQDSILEMENLLVKYKADYSALIAEVERIKAEKANVASKCDRATKLMSGLTGEKIRWSATSKGFQEQVNSLIGDVLLSAAFTTFIGFFDLFMRRNVTSQWKEILEEKEIKFKQDLGMIDYLSTGAQCLHWKENALPDDSLCYENAIIMKRFLRYPMVIDPSGQAITFLKNMYKDKRLMTTSFTDAQFMKHLESALRFGAPILVMDVEKVDPIMNNILNKETFKQGPRTLISLGDQDIDFSPSFEMFMCTRDSTKQLTPDLCSRVTFVNFTVTPSSLQSQCATALLKSERPDVDRKRAELVKLQAEFKVKVRQLEDDLLQALASVKGSILEDVKVIATLEKIKTESQEIEAQAADTEKVMSEIVQTSEQYEPAGNIAASIFFLLESMSPVNTFYQYSLSFFFEVFQLAFKTTCDEIKECSKDDYMKRLQIIIKVLFRDVFRKVAPGLKEQDVLVYALRLAQVMADQDVPLNQEALDLLLKGASVDVFKSDKAGLAEQCKNVMRGKLSEVQLKQLQDLHLLPQFAGLVGHMDSNEKAWDDFLHHLEPETAFPKGWEDPMHTASECNKVLQECLILKALRPDRVIFSCSKLVEVCLGTGFLDLPAFNLEKILETDSKATAPLMFVSVPGFDPSGKVTELALSTNKPLTSAAMGSEEGFKVADKAIATALKSGQWVLLKNVHLAIKWLGDLEKKLYGANPAPNFRLFLTMEFNPKIPANLIRQSRVYVFEPPSGAKASLQRSFAQIFPEAKTNREPVERCRLHFLLAFLHAVILERLRFYPVGWSKKYEFSDADQSCARDVIDNWLDSVSNNGQLSNIGPDKVPWDAIQALLSEAVYGGRVDNEFDHVVLKSFIKHLFCEESYNKDFSLNLTVGGEGALVSPDGRKREQFTEWIEALPAKGSPAWVGLPVHAEQMLRINRANYTLSLWMKIQGTVKSAPKTQKGGPKKRASIKNPLAELGVKIDNFLRNLPEALPKLTRTEDSIKDPLWRCYDREIGFGGTMLKRVRADLKLLQGVCSGSIKTTNDLRQLVSDMQTDTIPAQWRKYAVADTTVTDWISDFKRRCDQLQEIYEQRDNLQGIVLWFGGLFFPEAFLTASRQAVAQNLGVSLEELLLVVDIGDTKADNRSFIVRGLYMEGATWDQAQACLGTTEELNVGLPNTRLKWAHRESDDYKLTKEYLRLPVYLNSQRNQIVCPFNLKAPKTMPISLWLQRSVCLTLWTKV